MSPLLTIVLALSIVAAAVLWLARPIRHGQLLALGGRLVVLMALVAFLNRFFGFPFPLQVTARGGPEIGGGAVLVLFLAMVLGMFAHGAYERLSVPARARVPFDVGNFLAPVFLSPIVFIPLLAAMQNANVDLQRFDSARLMLLLVAFENGFFWKEYMNNRAARARTAPEVAS